MPVVKVLIVQIKLDTIFSYLEQVLHKKVLAFFSLFWYSFLFWAASCCLFIKFIFFSVSNLCQKLS